MNKVDLLSQLENAKNSYVLGLAAMSLFSEDQSYDHLDKSKCKFGSYEIDFSQVAALLRCKQDRDLALKEYLKVHLRALIKESFELLLDYCKNSDQENSLKKKDWYQFSRLIRNCISHNFKFEFNDYDKTKLPVTWNDFTIDLKMDSQPLELKFFGYIQVWELFDQFLQLARSLK